MTLSPAWLEELRGRTLLSGVIAPSVTRIKAGREYKACCPFHSEKTPSFTVNDEKHFYHCFGCGAHGDAIRFLTEARGLPFMDAVKELAAKAGMEVPAADPRAREKAERSAGLYDVMSAAERWFREQLDGVEGGAARKYLEQRGISEATRRKFGFGFAPDSRGKLKGALESFGVDALVEAGLLISQDGKDPYDRFRGRLTFPIRDARGRCIAFSARILGPGEPKYLNSPETPLFDKGRTLFNLDLAGPASRAAKRILIVEGQMDVIALDQAGIGEVVAPLGTALTEAQLERLWRLEPEPICCFDGDSAGQKAAIRAAIRALPHLAPERSLRFVALPPGEDPDDVVRAAATGGGDGAAQHNAGQAAFEALVAEAEPLVERLWRHEVESGPLDTPEARGGLRQRLLDHVAAIADGNVRQLYRDAWMTRFDEQFRPAQAQQRRPFVPRGEWKKGKFTPPEAPTSQAARAIGTTGIDRATASALLVGFLNYPETVPDHVEALAHLALPDRAHSSLRDKLIDLAMSGAALDRDGLATILAADGASGATAPRAMGFSFTRRDSDPGRARSDLAAAVEIIAARQEVEKALADATERLKRDFTDEAYGEQQRLIEARSRLKDRLASLAGSD